MTKKRREFVETLQYLAVFIVAVITLPVLIALAAKVLTVFMDVLK